MNDDDIWYSRKGTGARRDAIGYVRKLDDGSIAYVEEIRAERKRLGATTMRKYTHVTDVDTLIRYAKKVTEKVRQL